MPSWLWRDWLGPAARGPRGLLERRPRRRRFLPPPPPEGLPGPAFIVLSKLLGRASDPVQCCKLLRFHFPHLVAEGSGRVGAYSLFLRRLPDVSVVSVSLQLSRTRARKGDF